MKKIILATTALVSVAFAGNALAQESQMMSSMGNDINIGGYYEFGYVDYSDDAVAASGLVNDDGNKFYGDSELFIDFAAVSDAGLEYGVNVQLEIVNGQSADDTGADNNTDQASLYLTGDFGTVILGHNDHAVSAFQTWAPTHDGTYGQDDGQNYPRFVEGTPGRAAGPLLPGDTGYAAQAATSDQDRVTTTVKTFAGNPDYDDGSKITYMSQNFNGLQFGVSLEDNGSQDGDSTSFGVKYGTSVWGADVTLKGASADNGLSGNAEASSTSYGATIGYGDITFTAAYAEFDEGGQEPEILGFGLGYNISDDLSVGAYYATSEDDVASSANTTQEVELLSVSAQYTIAPGLTATAAYNSFDLEEIDSQTASDSNFNEGSEVVVQIEFAF